MRTWWIAVVLALSSACGDDSPARPDAGGDGATPDGPATRIEVHVAFDDGTPAPNVDVVFHDETGLPLTQAMTDAEGVTTVDMAGVAMVTVLGHDTITPAREMSTKMGVKPGDKLYFQLGYGGTTGGGQPFTAQLAVTYPANPPANATSYRFDVLCESVTGASTSFTHTIQNDCRRPGTNTIDAVVIARSSNTAELAFAVMPNITLAATGTTTVDFPGGWRTDWANFAVNYANAPAGATGIRTFMSLDVSGHAYFPFTSQPGTVTAGSSTQRDYQFVNGFATNWKYSFDLYYGDTMPRGSAYYAKQVAPGASVTVDLSATLLPRITDVGVEDATTVRPKVTWTQAGTHERASTGLAALGWSAPEEGTWSIQFPPDMAGTAVTIPALPDALADFRPPTDGSVAANPPRIQFGWASYLPTYDDFRQVNDVDRGATYEEIITMFPGF